LSFLKCLSNGNEGFAFISDRYKITITEMHMKFRLRLELKK